MKHFRWRGGVHPPENKLTSGMPIVDAPMPRRVVVSMAQSLGKPATPTVAKGDHVNRFDKIGEASGFISANVHTPISGTVKEVGMIAANMGHYVPAVVIEADDNDHTADLQQMSDAKPVRTIEQALMLKSEELLDLIREAGIVGMGGATFPTAVKLGPSKAGIPEILIINGSECEPYLTCDEAIMRECGEDLVKGIELMMHTAHVKRAVVCIEDNKPEAVAAMEKAAKVNRGIEVMALPTRYPQGGEKMLVKAVTGREIGSGQLPLSEGAIVQNVATALAVYHAVIWGMPLVERVMTVSGNDMAKRGNYRVPVGYSMGELTEWLGGMPDSTVQIIAGGTMMGRSLADTSGSTTKGTSGLLFLSNEEVSDDPAGPCVKCGKCVDSCPMGLQPYLIARLSELSRFEDAAQHHIMDCMECGCCSFSCIARRRLVDWIKVGKMTLREKK